MEYVITRDLYGNTKYLKSTVVPLTFTSKDDQAFIFTNEKSAELFMKFLRNQGVDTLGFHLGQKPPK